MTKFDLGWDLTLSITAIVICTGIYTIIGGLTAVMYTDTMQMLVFVVGGPRPRAFPRSESVGVFGMGFAMKSVGGFNGMLSIVIESNMSGFLDTIRPLDAGMTSFSSLPRTLNRLESLYLTTESFTFINIL